LTGTPIGRHSAFAATRRHYASILLGEALAAGTLDPAAEAVSLVASQRADLCRIKDAASALILLANQDLMACQHGIFRLCRAERRLGLLLGPLCLKLNHPVSVLVGSWAGGRLRLFDRSDGVRKVESCGASR